MIEEKGLDGIGFLNLDLTTVKSLGLTLVERCKINALLNSLAPEVERKAFTSSWSEHPGMNQNNVHSSNRMQSTTTKTIYPPVPIKPLHLQRISNEKLCSAAPAQVIPPETPTLPNIGISKHSLQIQINGLGFDWIFTYSVRPFPVNKAKIKATDDTLECDEEIYEVLKSPAIVIRENSKLRNKQHFCTIYTIWCSRLLVNDWDGECDLFSSDEFSDSDDEAPQSNKRENHRIESGKKSDCEKLRKLCFWCSFYFGQQMFL